MLRFLCGVVLLLALTAAAVPGPCSVPSTMAYQGKLTDSLGQPVADGAYNMRFYLYDNVSGGSLLWQEPWSGTEPVQVSGGIFDVQLGSSVALPPGAFTGDTWLAVEVNGTALPARFRIVSTGYAMRAMVADAVPANSITSSMIVDGQVMADDMADNAVTSAKIQDGAIGFADLGPNGAPAGQVIKRNSTNTGWTFGADESGAADADWTESGGNVYRETGNVGIGVSNPGYPLHVKKATGETEVQFESDSGKVRFNLDSTDDSYVDFQVNGVSKGTIGYEAGGDYLYLQKGAGTANTVALKNGNVGIGVTSPASKLHIAGDLRLDQRIIAADSGGLELATDDAITRVMIADTGNVGIGATTPIAKLHIGGSVAAQGLVANDSNGLDLWTNDGISRVRVLDNGNVGIGTTSPDYALHVFKSGGSVQSKIESDNGDADLLLDGTTDEPAVEFRMNHSYAGSIGYSTSNDYLFVHQGPLINPNIAFKYGQVGIGTLTPSAGFDIDDSSGLKVGPDGVTIGSLVEVTGTTNYDGLYTYVPLPTGFTIENTRVIRAEAYGASTSTWAPPRIDCCFFFESNHISMAWEGLGDNVPYRVLLMRVE